MIYLGIDPGGSGGIAAITTGYHERVFAKGMPDTLGDIWTLLESLIAEDREHACAMLEHVTAFPGQGVTSQFTFGQSYGGLQMALTALRIPWREVSPLKWQNALGVAEPKRPRRAPGEPPAPKPSPQERSLKQREHKNKTKAAAQQLYPQLKITHAIADALLIATYCLRQDWRGVGAPVVNMQPREVVPETSLF